MVAFRLFAAGVFALCAIANAHAQSRAGQNRPVNTPLQGGRERSEFPDFDDRRNTGSALRIPPATLDATLVRRMEKEMARCVIRKRPKEAASFLASTDGGKIDQTRLSFKVADLHDKLSLNYCLGSAIEGEYGAVKFSFAVSRFRSNLAEESYLVKHKAALQAAPHWTETIPDRLNLSPPFSDNQIQGDFSNCIVFRDSKSSDALLRTAIGSEAESAAANALVPVLSKCLSEGDKLELTVASIRSFVANGLWARSYYQATPQSVPVAGAAKN